MDSRMAGGKRRAAYHTHKTSLGNGAGRPASCVVLLEPDPASLVVRMSAPYESDESIYIEKTGPYHASSSICSISS